MQRLIGSNEMISAQEASHASQTITLFLCGDVMTGRGIDQVLPHPGNPRPTSIAASWLIIMSWIGAMPG